MPITAPFKISSAVPSAATSTTLSAPFTENVTVPPAASAGKLAFAVTLLTSVPLSGVTFNSIDGTSFTFIVV